MDQIKHENFVSAFREEISTINARSFFETTYGFTPHIIYEGNKPMVQALLRENKGILVSLRFENALIEDPKIVMRPVDDRCFRARLAYHGLRAIIATHNASILSSLLRNTSPKSMLR